MKSAFSQLLRWCASVAVLMLATQAVPAKPASEKKPPGGCDLYPIALSLSSVSNIATGTVLSGLKNGADKGNFGWLTWTGNRSRDALATSLTIPGDSHTYINPANNGDSQVTTKNWVRATGSDKAKPVRDALDKLKKKEIVVPLWYQVDKKGSGAYRIAGFAKIQLLGYDLDNTDRITVRFLGTVNCDHGNDAPMVSAGEDQVVPYPARAILNGSVTDDGLPAGGTLTTVWSKVSGPGTVMFSDPRSPVTLASFTDPGTYVLQLTADDGAKSASDDVTVTVNFSNNAPVANSQTLATAEDVAVNVTLTGSDPDGDPVSFVVMSSPSFGTLSGTAPNLVYTPAANLSGTDSFTFKVNDGVLDSAVATVMIDVTSVNDAPVAYGQSVSTDEDVTLPITLAGTDVEGTALTYTVLSAPTHGVLGGTGPDLVYTPAANYFGSDRLTFKVDDGALSSAPATVTITVRAVNDAPVALGDTVVVDEDGTVDLVLRGSDVEGSALTFSIVTPPAHGVLSGTPPNVRYMPALNYSGGDSFTFKVNDGSLDSANAVVSLSVGGVNDPPVAAEDSVSLDEDSSADILLRGNDPEGSPLTFMIVTPPAHGALSGTPPSVRYVPAANYNGGDSFTFKVNDGASDSAPARINLTVRSVNDAPAALDDAVALDEDTSVDVVLRGSDVDGDVLTFSLVNLPAHGTLSGTPPNVRYTPAANYNGGDSFSFKVNDGSADSALATVTVSVRAVNDAPVALDASVSLDEDSSADLVLRGSDVEGSGLTFLVVNPPAHGVLSGTPPNLHYVPAANYNGGDSFTFKVNDGQLDSAPATISLTVVPVNDAPVAADAQISLDEDTTADIVLTGSDVEGSPLGFLIVSPPAHGSLSGAPPNVKYTPAANYNGSDSFTFKVNDGSLDSAPALVSISVRAVNDVPVALDDAVSLDEDTSVNIMLRGTDVEGSALTFSIAAPPAHGALVGTPPAVRYVPSANYYGSDSFMFKVSDGELNSATATVSITVRPVDDAPFAVSAEVSLDEDTVAGIVLNGSDVEGSDLAFVVVDFPVHGVLSGTPPNLNYTPAANYHGTDGFTFKVNDGNLDSALATVALTVNSVNDLPVAASQDLTTAEDTAVTVTLSATDVDGDPLTFVVMNGPAHGTLSGTAPALTYTPAANYNGVDSFQFIANDGMADSALATVSLTVTPVNDAPVASSQSVSTLEDTALSVTLGGTDVENSELTFVITAPPTHGTLSGFAPDLVYTPAANYNGPDSFTFRVNDGELNSAPAVVSITVTPVNDVPVAHDQDVQAIEAESTPITLTATDVDGDLLTYEIVTGPTNGTLSGVAPDLTYTPNVQGHPEMDAFTFTVSDGVAVSTVATVTIDIIYNEPPVVNAGPDRLVRAVTDVITLNGSVSDDGKPRNSTLQISWGMKFGPGTVTFGDDSSAVTSASFSTSGLYILELSASDSQYTSRDLVEVRVDMICSANPSGVAAWWPADLNNADVISGNEAVLEGGTDYGVGKVGGAFVFDGVDDRVTLVPSASLDIGAANALTIEFWMNSADVMRAVRLVGFHSGVDVFPEDLGVNIYQSGGELHAQVVDTNSVIHEMVAFNGLANNVWTHVAVTYDRATGQGKIYVNGGLKTIANLGNFRPRTTFPLFFGNTLQDTVFFEGALDEITFYTRALDGQEIYEIFAANGTGKCQPGPNQAPIVNAGPDLGLADVSSVALLNGSATDDGLPVPSSLRAAWSVVSGPGTVAFSDPTALVTSATFTAPGVYVLRLSVDDAAIVRSDVVEVRVATLCTIKNPPGLVAWWPASGNGSDVVGGREARLGGGTSFVLGRVGGAFNFDGVNDCARVPGDSGLDVGVGNGFSIEFWMNSADVARNTRVVAFHSGLAAGGTNMGVNIFQLAGEIHAQIPDFAGAPHEFVATSSLTANTWTHVAVTYDRVRGLGRIYINGVQRTVSTVGSYLARTGYNLYLGNTPFDVNYYKGLLDEVSVYNRTLDAQEVFELFNAGNAGKCPNDLNQGPIVNAGPDLYARDVAQAVNLAGSVTDDGLPPGSVVRSIWSVVDGPGAVNFVDAAAAATTATFAVPGTYVLRLTGDDGVIAVSDLVEVRVGSLCTVKDPTGLVAWWPGNGNANDVVGGNHGRLAGGVTFGSARVSAGFRFDGSNDVVQVPAHPSLDVGQGNGLTLEFWVNSTDVARLARLVGWHFGIGSASTNFGVNVYQQSGGALSAQIYDVAGASHEFVAASTLFSNVWTHVAVTYDRTTGQGRIYTNGVLRTTSTLGVFTPRTSYNLFFGNFPTDSGFFRGTLDEVSIYNRPLDAQEVYDIYNSGAIGKCPKDQNQAPLVNAGPNIDLPTVSDIAALNGQVTDDGLPTGAGLRVNWSKLDGPGTVSFGDASAAVTTASFSAPGIYVLSLTADDAAIARNDLVEVRVAMPCSSAPSGLVGWWPGNGNAQDVIGGRDGRLAGGVSFASGRVSAAFSFDGANDAVQVPADSALDVGQGAGLTAEFWMNPADVTRNARVVGWHSGLAASGTNFGVNVQMLGRTVNAQIYDLAGAPHDVNLANVLTNNTWAHVAVTYDRASGQARIYLNGVLRTTLAVGSYTPRTSYKLFFGNVPFDANFYRGLLDEVSIYDHALTSNEVAAVYGAAAAGKCPPAPVGPMFVQAVAAPEPMDTVTENERGQRVSMTDASGTTIYGYDAAGRVNRITKSWSAHAGAPATETALIYNYDNLGRFVGVHSTSVNGASMGYVWNDANQLMEVSDPHSGSTVYHYDAAGKAVSYTYPDGVMGSRFGVLDNVTCNDEAGVVCDADGHRARRTVTEGSRTITTYYVVSPLTVTGTAQLVEELTFDSGDPLFATPVVTRVYVHGIHTISQEELINDVWKLSFFE